MPSLPHYFDSKPETPDNRIEFTAKVRGRSFRFITGGGVFSRQRLDPGSRLLLETLTVKPGDSVLDLGAGYGALGIVAASFSAPGEVLMVDINQRAVELTERNIRLNGAANARALVSDGFQGLTGTMYDHILLNPPIRAGKRVYYPWLAEARDHLLPGGRLWVVVRERQGAPTLERRLRELFERVEVASRRAGYRVLVAQKGGETL